MITEKVKKSFTKSAKSYKRHGSLQREVSRSLIKNFFPKGISSPKKILDIGSGTGFTSADAKRKWPSASITAIDIAEPMVAKTKSSGIPSSITADAIELPFKNRSFDMVVSSLAFQWIADYEKLFLEIERVLKSGGLLLFSTIGPGNLLELRTAYDRACRECTGRPANFPEITNIENLAEKLRGTGFYDINWGQTTKSRNYEDVNDFFLALKGVGATAPRRPSNPPRRDIISKTVSYYPCSDGPINATYEIIYVNGIKSGA